MFKMTIFVVLNSLHIFLLSLYISCLVIFVMSDKSYLAYVYCKLQPTENKVYVMLCYVIMLRELA